MQARSLLYSSHPAILDGVEVSARSAGSGTMGLSPLAHVARLVQPHLEDVEMRIAQQAAAFDPALEGYVVYAVGSRGKRLRPLLALLAGYAAGFFFISRCSISSSCSVGLRASCSVW